MTTAPVQLSSFVNGAWIRGEGREFQDDNPSQPATPVATFGLATSELAGDALQAGVDAFEGWRATPIHERAAILRRTAVILMERQEEIAADLSREQGKTLTVARGEVARAAAIFEYFAHDAHVPLGSMYASPRPRERIFTTRVPLGQVLVITPWNVPIGTPAWKIAPALVHGNTVAWKPSEETPLIAVRLVEAMTEAGLPAGVCNLVLADGPVAEEMLRDARVSACTFTGSTRTGKHLIAVGAERGIKVLAEMGGKNAAIVLADADLDWTVKQVVSAAMGWTGQRCTATSRALVARSIYDEFLTRLVAEVESLRVGDPFGAEVDLGPSSTRRQFEVVQSAIRAAIDEGGHVATGSDGHQSPDDGFYVTPTVIVDAAPDHTVFLDEIFGPVLAVLPIDDFEEGLRLANLGRYGLSGSVFTRDLDRVLDSIDRFDVGVLHINSESCGADPHVPFGGMKDSGTSHKEMGEEAKDFFTQQRTVYLRAAEL